MARTRAAGYTRSSKVLKAPQEALYRAYLDRDALPVWLPPEAATGKVHGRSDHRVQQHTAEALRPEDKEAGCHSTREKLARYLE